MDQVNHDGLDSINGGGRNELEDPKSVIAGNYPNSKIKTSITS